MLWTALVLGLAGSFHCIGMCGPIAFVLPVDRSSKSKLIFQTFLYHFGRLIKLFNYWITFWFYRKRIVFGWFSATFINFNGCFNDCYCYNSSFNIQ